MISGMGLGPPKAARRIAATPIGKGGHAAPVARDFTYITYLGDSNIEWGYISRYRLDSTLRSNTADIGTEAGYIEVFALPTTLQWRPPGGTYGSPVTFPPYGWRELPGDTVDTKISLRADPAYSEIPGEGIETQIPFGAGEDIGHEARFSTWAQVFTKNRLAEVNLGAVGDTVGGVAARLAQVGSVDSLGRPITPSHHLVCLYIGVNDIYFTDDAEAVALVTDALSDVLDTLTGAGHIVLLCTVANDGGESVGVTLYNTWIRSVDRPGVYVVDIDAATQEEGGYVDGLHITPPGAVVAGQVVARKILALTGAYGTSDYALGSSTVSIMDNGALAGIAGVLTGMTGEAAWDATFVPEDAGTCVASKETVSGQHDKQVFTITGATDGGTVTTETTVILPPSGEITAAIDFTLAGGVFSYLDGVLTLYSDDESQTENHHTTATYGGEQPYAIGKCAGTLSTPYIELPSWADHAVFRLTATLAPGAGHAVIKLQNAGAHCE